MFCFPLIFKISEFWRRRQSLRVLRACFYRVNFFEERAVQIKNILLKRLSFE